MYLAVLFTFSVQPDPVVEYLEASSSPKTVQDEANKPSTSTDIVTCSPQPDTSIDFSPPAKRTRLARSRGSKIAKLNNEIENSDTKSTGKDEIRKKVTCGKLNVQNNIGLPPVCLYICILSVTSIYD